jgi:hypothetical protein
VLGHPPVVHAASDQNFLKPEWRCQPNVTSKLLQPCQCCLPMILDDSCSYDSTQPLCTLETHQYLLTSNTTKQASSSGCMAQLLLYRVCLFLLSSAHHMQRLSSARTAPTHPAVGSDDSSSSVDRWGAQPSSKDPAGCPTQPSVTFNGVLYSGGTV